MFRSSNPDYNNIRITMVRISVPEVKRFVTECLRTVGAKIRPAKQQADLFIYADRTGHSTLGLSKLQSCIDNIESGACSPNNKPKILKEEKSMTCIDVNNVMGATAGHFAMDRAIKLANKTGVGWVAATGCKHGAEPFSYWVKQAANKGLIGMVMSTPSLPLCEQLQLQVPEPTYLGSGQTELVPLKDVQVIYKNRNVEELKVSQVSLQTASYEVLTPVNKARVLATMLGLFKGSPAKKNLQSWSTEPLEKNLVHCFIAVNPACFALGFDGRSADYMPCCCWKEWDEMDPKLPELLQNCECRPSYECEEHRSLDYKIKQINVSLALAHKLGVKPMDLEPE